MTHPLNTAAQQNTRINNQKENERRANEKKAVDKLKQDINAQHSIADILKLMADVNLDSPPVKQVINDVKKNYSSDKSALFFATILLFAKEHVLTKDSFNFLKNSMNIIEHVFDFVSSLLGNGLLSNLNLDKFFNLPALKNLNALFNILSKDNDQTLDQTSFDDVMSNAEPIDEKFVNGVNGEPLLKEVASAFMDATKNGIDSEEILEAIKKHPAPETLAKAVIQLKDRGVELTHSLLDKLMEANELNEPKALVDKVIDAFASELSKSPDDSIIAYATQAATKAVTSSLCSAASEMPKQVWSAGMAGISSMFSFFKPATANTGMGKTEAAPKGSSLSAVSSNDTEALIVDSNNSYEI